MNVGFLMFDGLEELDLVGPWEMISVWSKYQDGPENYFTVCAPEKKTVVCAKGMRMAPDHGFDTCPPLDFLFIPGGQGARTIIQQPEYLDFVQRQAKESCRQVLSVCTGALVLQAAGLLKGRRATTHWSALATLRADNDIQVVEQRFVRDGNIWTAAGVSSGLDMTLEFIATQAGEDVAGEVQLYTEYYPQRKRYGNAADAADLPDYIRNYLPDSTHN